MDWFRRHWRWAAVVALGTLLLTFVAIRRKVDGDEGIYLYASVLVAEGRVPYRYFSHPQMPYELYAYAPAGHSLDAARGISVLFGMISLGLFAAFVRRRGQAGWLALLALATCGIFLGWVPQDKT